MKRVVVLVTVLVFGLLLLSDGYASRSELGYDLGTRNIRAWHQELLIPGFRVGLATECSPSAWPCVIRQAKVYVDSTVEFRLRILDENGQDLVEPATISAIEPVSWATREFPGGLRIEAGDFYVLVEYPEPDELRIARTDSALGQEGRTWKWNSPSGVWRRFGGEAVIRATVDLPVNVQIVPGDVRNQHLFAYFDSLMDPSTLNDATVRLEGQSPIAGEILYDEALMRLEFIPDSLLDDGPSMPRFTISADVKDVYGNQLAEETSRSIFVRSRIDDSAPAAPVGLQVIEEDMAFALSWHRGLETDIRGHFVYWAPFEPDTDGLDWLESAERMDVGEQTSTRLELQANDALYQLGVSTYDCCRNESDVSCTTGVPHRGSALLLVESVLPPHVSDQGVTELTQAIYEGCFDFTLWDEAHTGALPSCSYLEQFDSMFWAVGERFYTPNSGSWELMQRLLEHGGALFYEGPYVLGLMSLGHSFLSDWLRIHWENEWTDEDAPVLVGVAGDPIGDGVELLAATPGAASINYFEPMEGAVGFLTVEHKDETCGIRYRDPGEYGYSLVFSTACMAKTFHAEQRSKLMSRALCWLEGKELDFRIAANTRLLEPYSVLELFVSANALAGVECSTTARASSQR